MPAIQTEAFTPQLVAETSTTISFEQFSAKIKEECVIGSGIDPELFEYAIAIVSDIEVSGEMTRKHQSTRL